MSITENQVKFKSLEEKVFKYVCECGREIIKEILESYDEELRESRDKKGYRNKGKRRRTIKTVMGEVEFERNVYETVSEEGEKRYEYRLDKELGLSRSGYFSELMSELIAKRCCESSYRNAAQAVSEQTGQVLSHTAAWNVVQTLGEEIDKQEIHNAALAKAHRGIGVLESKVLFEEQDGIWLKLQGVARKKYGSSKEMKLAIAYDGAIETEKGRYNLSNKVACANFEGVNEFVKRKEGVIASTYNVDEIESRVLNGDGAEWIKKSIADEDTHFQLDPFHRNKAIYTNVKDKRKRAVLFELLRDGRVDDVFSCIEGYMNCSEDEEEIKGLQSLGTYFSANKTGLVAIKDRDLDLPKGENTKEHCHLGCMESNIFSIIGNRMKGRRGCWSIEGGNNLARLLCLKMTGKLSERIGAISTVCLPERYTEEQTVTLSAAQIPLRVGKGYNGFTQSGAFPANSSYAWLRNIGRTHTKLC